MSFELDPLKVPLLYTTFRMDVQSIEQHDQVVDKAQRGGHRTLRRLRRRHRSD
jgi:hypothetical protein